MNHKDMNDIQTLAGFVNGWWPGLEGDLPWGDDEAMANHPVLLAARRLLESVERKKKYRLRQAARRRRERKREEAAFQADLESARKRMAEAKEFQRLVFSGELKLPIHYGIFDQAGLRPIADPPARD